MIYSDKPKEPKVDYLAKFVKFLFRNLNEYKAKNHIREVDWRIKEALMYAIGTIRDQLWENQALTSEIRAILLQHVLPELKSDHALMRSRACHTLKMYGDITFQDNGCIKQIIDGIFINL